MPDDVARVLALHVNSGFALLFFTDPNTGTGGLGGPGAAVRVVLKCSSEPRCDRGCPGCAWGVAVLVMVWLVYRFWQRKKELPHLGLSGSVVGRRGRWYV